MVLGGLGGSRGVLEGSGGVLGGPMGVCYTPTRHFMSQLSRFEAPNSPKSGLFGP